MNKTKNN